MITRAPGETPGWVWAVFLAVVLTVLIVGVVLPFVRGFKKRIAELRLEDRKAAVRKWCLERGFKPREDDLDAVVRRKKR